MVVSKKSRLKKRCNVLWSQLTMGLAEFAWGSRDASSPTHWLVKDLCSWHQHFSLEVYPMLQLVSLVMCPCMCVQPMKVLLQSLSQKACLMQIQVSYGSWHINVVFFMVFLGATSLIDLVNKIVPPASQPAIIAMWPADRSS